MGSSDWIGSGDANHLFGAHASPAPMVTCHSGTWEQSETWIRSNALILFQQEWEYRLQNGNHFAQASVC